MKKPEILFEYCSPILPAKARAHYRILRTSAGRIRGEKKGLAASGFRPYVWGGEVEGHYSHAIWMCRRKG